MGGKGYILWGGWDPDEGGEGSACLDTASGWGLPHVLFLFPCAAHWSLSATATRRGDRIAAGRSESGIAASMPSDGLRHRHYCRRAANGYVERVARVVSVTKHRGLLQVKT